MEVGTGCPVVGIRWSLERKVGLPGAGAASPGLCPGSPALTRGGALEDHGESAVPNQVLARESSNLPTASSRRGRAPWRGRGQAGRGSGDGTDRGR